MCLMTNTRPELLTTGFNLDFMLNFYMNLTRISRLKSYMIFHNNLLSFGHGRVK